MSEPLDRNRSALRDALGRRIRYLRVSLTDRCNLRCRYCMPPEGVHKITHREMLRLEELASVVGVLVTDLGIEKVRVTGGEPLVRRGAIDFLRALGAIPGLRDLALTTNACYLEEIASAIRQAGVRRLNISLDTLRPDLFRRITGTDDLDRVLRGIEAAARAGFATIKLNTVILPENLEEAPAIVRFAAARGMQARFIERMPSPGTDGSQGFVSAASVRDVLARHFTLTPVTRPGDAGSRAVTATLYRVEAVPAPKIAGSPETPPLPADTMVGFITPVSAPFCGACDRIRLRGDGRLLPCLSEDDHFDLKVFVRPTLRPREMADYIRGALALSKHASPEKRQIQAMWRIGG